MLILRSHKARGNRTAALVLFCALLAACGGNDGTADLQQYIVEVSLRPGGAVEPMPQFLPYEAFTYSAASLRSPFDVPIMAGTTVVQEPVNDVQPDFDRTPEALEAFALSNLNMVGMITRGSTTIALIQDENGRIHRVGRGSYLGRNHGRVTKVLASEVELTELVPSGDGAWVERPRTLVLQR
jgi:type IV pilus assembly protein PilP